MKNNKLRVSTRVFLAICSICLVAVLFTPIWRIELNAPQYPEGLSLKIHANDIKGNVDIINGLNHYIGMKTLHTADFPEFTILPYCVLFFSVFFLIGAILNRRKGFFTVFLLFVAFGIIAMVDFWRWEYNYGHNLDPHAAIIVPGMAYQPPLLGYKQLLNFGAYSVPDIGGWIFIGCGALLLVSVLVEKGVFSRSAKKQLSPALVLILILTLGSCKAGPDPIKIGKDNCAYCKMTISDAKFGGEIVTSTGMIYKFDDLHCLELYLSAMENDKRKEASIYLTDFCGSHELVEANISFLLKSADLKCPMDGHFAAFKNKDSLELVMQLYKGELVNVTLK